MSEIESAYLERDQIQSTNLRDEYLQHFLANEPVVGIEFEAQLQKTLLPSISSSEVKKYAEKFRTSCNCVIKAIEPQATSTIDDLKNLVSKITSLEEERNISAWDEEHIPEEIVNNKPDPGSIVQQFEYPNIGVTELILSKGMKVCYKCTDFLDDQALFTESDYFSCSMGSAVAGEIGVFGYKPSVLMDMLAGKRAEVGTKLGAYMRTFSGDCSPMYLETALQMTTKLQTDLKKSWPSIMTSKTNMQFWQHEYTKHGACMVDPGVPFNQTSYFEKGHELWSLYNVFDILQRSKITPSKVAYKEQQLISAIQKVTGFDPVLLCKTRKAQGSTLDEYVLKEIVICLDRLGNNVRICPPSKVTDCKGLNDEIYFLQ